MTVERKETFSDIVETGLSPSNLRVEPETSSFVLLNNVYRRALCLVQGLYKSVSYVAHVFPWGALKIAAYGSGYVDYASITDAAPADYGAGHQLDGDPAFHKLDISVPDAPVLIRVQHWQTLEWGDDIYVPAGFMSIELDGRSVQVKLATVTATDYHITGFW